MQERSAVEQVGQRKARETGPSELKSRQVHADRRQDEEDDREDQKEEVHAWVSYLNGAVGGI